jgi:hypothetical protein
MKLFLTATALSSLLLLTSSCGDTPTGATPLSKEPVSVRGWIADVDGAGRSEIPQVEAARRLQLFQNTYVAVEKAPYISGGIAENGAFVLLDVPPGDVNVVFTAPGAPAARLVLRNIPGTADVIIPAILLRRDSVELLQPKQVIVRIAGSPSASHQTASVAGVVVPVRSVAVNDMADRRDLPTPPSSAGGTALAVVK